MTVKKYWMNLLERAVKVLFWLFICNIGNACTVRANIGYAPWQVLFQGIANHTPLTIGQASILIAVLVLILCCFWGKEYPGIGTLLDAVFSGLYLDWILDSGLIPKGTNLWTGILIMLIGFVFISVGTVFYMRQAICTGPKDTLLIVMTRKTPLSVSMIKLTTEGIACLIGWLLGGPVGVGTLLGAFALGWVMQPIFKFFKFTPDLHQENLIETIRRYPKKSK